MNISEAVEKITYIESSYFPLDIAAYKAKVAAILQELLDSGGVADEYMEVNK